MFNEINNATRQMYLFYVTVFFKIKCISWQYLFFYLAASVVEDIINGNVDHIVAQEKVGRNDIDRKSVPLVSKPLGHLSVDVIGQFAQIVCHEEDVDGLRCQFCHQRPKRTVSGCVTVDLLQHVGL